MTEEYILATLAEEASEIIKPACKAIRFGLHNSFNKESNLEEIIKEFHDLQATIELLIGKDFIPDRNLIELKKQKMEKYFK